VSLRQYVIYEKPRDYPGGFVVRGFSVGPGIVPDRVAQYAQTLDAARELVPPGLFRLPRWPDDEPQIVEVWT
jgi:hypothetical protein